MGSVDYCAEAEPGYPGAMHIGPEFLGFPALKPVAMMEKGVGRLCLTAFFVSEFVAATGPVTIDLGEMKEHKRERSFQRAFGKDLRRFLTNSVDYPDLSNRFTHLLQKPIRVSE